MKTKHIFWGLFFITIGALILLNNLDIITLDLQNVWKFWPLVLVIWGLAILIRNNFIKSFLAALAAIVLAIAVFAFFNSAFYFVGDRFSIHNNGISIVFDGKVDTSNYNIPYNSSINKAKFDFHAGAGTFIIADTTDQLLSAVTTGIKNNYELTQSGDNNSVIKLEMKSRKFTINNGNLKNKVKIKLNTAPVWDFNFELGAASSDFDLRPYKVDNIKIHMGAASFKLKLGDKNDSTNLNLQSGVSSIDILIPDSAGCKIKSNVTLSTKDFYGFKKVNSDTYITNNFYSAKKRIYLRLHAGLSSIKVKRYSEGW